MPRLAQNEHSCDIDPVNLTADLSKEISSIFSLLSVVSVRCRSGRRVGQRPWVCLWMVALFFFLYIVQMKSMLPGFIHVFEWSFFYYCKYRNCNPVIKWNMTDFLHKKNSLFLQCSFRGCWYPIHLYTELRDSVLFDWKSV